MQNKALKSKIRDFYIKNIYLVAKKQKTKIQGIILKIKACLKKES